MDDGCALNMIRGRVSWLGERIPAKPGETGRGEGSPSSGGSTRVELRAMNIVSVHRGGHYLVTRQVSVHYGL